jgi:hypothetical protein
MYAMPDREVTAQSAAREGFAPGSVLTFRPRPASRVVTATLTALPSHGRGMIVLSNDSGIYRVYQDCMLRID